MTEEVENVDIHDQEEQEEQIVQKPKKKLTEKQKEIGRQNLAKGRAILAEKKKKEKEEADKKKDELILIKAERLKKRNANKENKIKEVLGDEPDVEIEERIIVKPKKKRIIYKEESDSEEEVIIKPRRSKKETIPEPAEPKQEMKIEQPRFSIKFC